jgi:N-acetyl-gamma-glutamyl-phosphate reductase
MKLAIIGGAGYTGGEVLRYVLQHPQLSTCDITVVSSSHAGKPVWHAHGDLEGYTSLTFAEAYTGADVVILCLGHGASTQWMVEHDAIASHRVIDLGNDFRIEHASSPWVYGLPEAHRDRIRTATRVANPGCFATAIQLGLLPLATTGQCTGDVVVHAITGSTGAGQAPSATSHYSWREHNVQAYKVFEHQHEPEILQTLGDVRMHFVPVRGPFTRGIYASIVIPGSFDRDAVLAQYRTAYASHPMVRVMEASPDLKSVVNTSLCRIGIATSDTAMVITSVIDNLGKGAAGQAIQNLNLMCGFDETSGLFPKPLAY